jgi:hypothetical protein
LIGGKLKRGETRHENLASRFFFRLPKFPCCFSDRAEKTKQFQHGKSLLRRFYLFFIKKTTKAVTMNVNIISFATNPRIVDKFQMSVRMIVFHFLAVIVCGVLSFYLKFNPNVTVILTSKRSVKIPTKNEYC